MIRSTRSLRAFAAAGAALAGYIDAVGFLETLGYFVSFMSGNSTRLGVGLLHVGDAAMPAMLIGSFVFGVAAGTLVGRIAGAHHVARVFVAVALTLALAATLGDLGAGVAAMLLVAVAMGMENAAIEADGEVRIGLTYMTGTLVKVGQHLASALQGGPRWRWASYLMLWCGMIVGAVIGASVHPHLGTDALWPAVVLASAMAATAWAWPQALR